MNLNVLMVTPYFPPIINGPSLHVYHLVKGLIDRGIHVRVHTISGSSKNIPHLDLKLNDLNVVSFKSFFDLRGPSKDQPISISYIISTIKKCDDFDIVHIHDFPKVSNDLLILVMKKLKGNKPLIFTPHGSGTPSPAYRLSSKMYWSLGIPQKVLLTADQIIAVGSLQAKQFTEIFGSHKVSLIEEAVPDYYFLNEPSFIDDGKLKILFVGRIIKEKGIDYLLYAIDEAMKIKKYEKNVELVCIGPDYGYLQEVSRIINKLKLNDVVRIVGPLPEHEKIKYLSWCDLLVLPSFYEAFGLPILEAMARGKPTIATETPGCRSLIKHGETGFLVKIGDSQGIACALMQFLQDPKLKQKMGENALKHAFRFSMKNMIEKHIRLYQIYL